MEIEKSVKDAILLETSRSILHPGDKRANWKLQRSTDLLFWEDIQSLSEQDLIGLEKVIGAETEFYRVVEY
ncbi:MAG: hypothetical protein ACFHW5_00545 [Verrucomicrobiota bacterium]